MTGVARNSLKDSTVSSKIGYVRACVRAYVAAAGPLPRSPVKKKQETAMGFRWQYCVVQELLDPEYLGRSMGGHHWAVHTECSATEASRD